jgi:hypothetical protein
MFLDFTGRYDPAMGAVHDDGISSSLTSIHPPLPEPSKDQSKLD